MSSMNKKYFLIKVQFFKNQLKFNNSQIIIQYQKRKDPQNIMLSTQYLSFQKTLLNIKCQQKVLYQNQFANLLFNSQKKTIPYNFSFPYQNKQKPISNVVSLKQQIIKWFKSLTNQEKSDITTIKDTQFLNFLIKYTQNQYINRQINFSTGYTIANLFPNQSLKSKFNYVKQKIAIALTSSPIIYINFQQNIQTEKFIEWLEEVTIGKIFQYSHKIINKQKPEENCLWFNPFSFHSLDQWFVNEIQKSIQRNYFKKDQIQTYKIKQLHAFLSQKYQNEAKYVAMKLEQIRKLTKEEIQNASNLMKIYENHYYENVRQNVIDSLENLDKDMKKKRKNKRKIKNKHLQNPKNHSFISQNPLNQENYLKKTDIEPAYKQQQKQDYQQSTKQQQFHYTQLIQSNNQNKVFDSNDANQNFTQKIKLGKTKKHCKSKQQRQSKHSIEKTQKQKNHAANKNLVITRDRQLSPHSTIDCSKSIVSSSKQETFKQVIPASQTNTNEQFSQQIQHFNSQIMLNNELEINQQSNKQNKKRKKRKNNNNSNKNLQQIMQKISRGLINKQFNNFVDNLSIESNNLYESKVICFERIRYFVKTILPQTEAILFGSNAIGLSLPTSDLDVMLCNIPFMSKNEIKDFMAHIAIEINSYAWIVSCSTYLNAKAPLIRIEIDPKICYFQMKRHSDHQMYDPTVSNYLDIQDRKKAKNISIDLTINLDYLSTGLYASPSTQLMRSYVSQNAALQRIVLAFKYILAKCEFNKNYNGGLGSYCIFIMIAAYFKEFKDQLPEDQGQIFLNILKFYSEDFENNIKLITLRNEGSCFISLQQILNISNISSKILSNPLRIIDPLSTNVMSSSCSQYNLIKFSFSGIRTQILQQFQKIEIELSTYTAKELNKLGINVKLIQKWINKYEIRKNFSLQKIFDQQILKQIYKIPIT